MQGTEDFFEQALDASPCGCIVVDAAGRLHFVNGAVERLFGYDRRELLGQPVEIFIPHRFRHEHCRKRIAVSEKRKPKLLGWPARYGLRKDGREIELDIELTPVDFGDEPCTLAAITDLTERKKL